jgi:MFS family permease
MPMNARQARINLVLCSILHGLNHYGVIFYKPMYPSMSSYFSLNSISELTTRMTILYAGYGIANFLSGLFARKISLRLILFFGSLLMSTATLMVSFVHHDSYNFTIILVFLIGIGGGVYHPAANTLVTTSYEGKPGLALGILSFGSAIGFVVAPFIGEYVGERHLGFQALFMLSGCVGIAFSILFLFFVKDHAPIKEQASTAKKGSTALFALIIFLFCIPVTIRELSNWSFYEISPFWVAYGFSNGITVSLVQSMQYLPGLIVQPLTGKLCDKFGSHNIILVTFSMIGIGLILFSIPNIAALWTAMIFFGIGMSTSTVSSETYMTKLADKNRRALVYGIIISVGMAIGGYCAGFSGMVIDHFGRTSVHGYNVWFILSGSAVIISTTIFIAVTKILRKQHR